MNRIDELPLDVFDEGDEASSGVTDGLALADEVDAAGAGWPPMPTESAAAVRAYDVVGITALAVVLGLAMRILGAGFVTPVLNVGLALLMYGRAGQQRRGWYYARVAEVRERVEHELATVKDATLPEQVAAYRIVYDVGAVITVAIAVRVMVWMSGLERIMPGGLEWTFSCAAAVAVYLVTLRSVDRATLHVWMYQRLSQLKR